MCSEQEREKFPSGGKTGPDGTRQENKRLHPRMLGLNTRRDAAADARAANTPPLIVFAGFDPGTWRFSQNLPLSQPLGLLGDVTGFPTALFGFWHL